MMRPFLRSILAALLLVSAMACDSYLEVENLNEPDTQRVLATPAKVESAIAGSFGTWFVGAFACCAVGIQQQAASMEISTQATTGGMVERSRLPRLAIDNSATAVFAGADLHAWTTMYRAIAEAATGIKLLDGGVSLGSAASDARARSWARFVQGIAHGYLAQTYDQMLVVTEDWDPLRPELVRSGTTGMTAALGMLDDAIAIANGTPFTIPSEWVSGPSLTNADLVRLARTYKARFRANAARTPAEAEAVDWNAVIADLTNGITQDFAVTSNRDNWYFGPQEIHALFGAWNQVSMWYLGMADTSGAYQEWESVRPVENRAPFVVRTPDLRWPRGDDTTMQQLVSNRGTYIRNKGSAGNLRTDRGTWRFSYYTNNRYQTFYDGGFLGEHPVILKSEMDLLLAEAYIRTGQEALALPIINTYRAAAGLPAATLAGVPDAPSCVPRLPNSACGTLLEALKYEKRIETMYLNTWFFDSRRWGDLHRGTAVDHPVPASELLALGVDAYTRGGWGLPGGAALGTYGFY